MTERADHVVGPDLASAATAAEACQRVAEDLADHSGAAVTVLLRVHDGLRTFGASGTWRIYYGVSTESDAVGEAYRTGRTTVESPPDDRYPLAPPSAVAMWVPVPGGAGSVGVLKLEFPDTAQADHWRPAAEADAAALGARLGELGYTPRETMAERLVRHALSIVSSTNETTLVAETLHAARDISGLSAAVAITPAGPDSPCGVYTEPGDTRPLVQRIGTTGAGTLHEINERAQRHGAWYTSGDPADAVSPAPRGLVEIGARTVIAIPIGVRPGDSTAVAPCRTLLVMDEAVRPVSAMTVGLLELLAAQAYVSLERLRLLEKLRAQARRDPLTGLGHQATFGERMVRTRPGRTALLLMDVDNFKEINDTAGHSAGDRVLVDLANAAQSVLRRGDELYRIGGDEFVAVIEVSRAAEARGVALRLVEAAHKAGCTVSVGVALQASGEAAEKALHRADTAMHLAKRAGRDRIELAAAPAGANGAATDGAAAGVSA